MFEKRNLKCDLLALALLALAVFLSAALFSYDPADPPSSLGLSTTLPNPKYLRPLGRGHFTNAF